MNTLKKFILICTIIGLYLPTMADEPEPSIDVSVGGDLVSSYIWRGVDCAGTSFQPSLSLGWKGLSLSGWGSVGIDKTDTKEFDLTLEYGIGGLSVSITDYYFSYFGISCPYFEYGKDTTTHVFEAQIGYDFGFLAINWYTNFAGADGVKNTEGDMAYSSYISLAAPFETGAISWEAELGFVPWKTDFYTTDGFALTNISIKATKPIKISDEYSIGLFSQAIWNPTSDGGFFVMGLSF